MTDRPLEAERRNAFDSAAPPPESDPELAALIADEIRIHGPITFARFMDLALYAPDLGYYVGTVARPGRGGDFLTAPETHPIFGAVIARHVADVWDRLGRPKAFTVREYGAGTGTLAAAILDATAADRPDLSTALRYEAVEASAPRRLAMDPRIAPLDPHEAARSAPATAGLVIANEYLDALPVNLVQQTPDGLREIHVDRTTDTSDGAAPTFREVLLDPSSPALAARLANEGITLQPGQRGEIALSIGPWVAEVGRWLGSGASLIVDYGYPAAELYGLRHLAGTLLGYAGHQVVDDPLAGVGRQDLTAHVDITALEKAAANEGLDILGSTTQAQFLIDLGLQDLLERARAKPEQSLGEYLELRSGIVRLIDPRHTGGFRVVVLGRGVPDEPPLLGFRRPRT